MMALEFKVPSMACSACAEKISKAVMAVDPSATIEADPKTKWVKVETTQPEGAVKTAIANAGYPIA